MRLTSGRKEPCKNNIGGIKHLYLATWVSYDVRTIVGYRDLLVTSFPVTQIYEFKGQDITLTETLNEDGSYTQDISIKLTSQDLSSAQVLSILMKNKVFAITVDYLGNNRISGIVNGMDVEVTANGGGSKVDFNGYDVALKGQEEFKSPFVNDLEGAGLTDKTQTYGCILASSSKPASLSNKVSDCNVIL